MKPSPRAFTLVELLIVVAIIAILAAIAVPNFLEAQVRSKVSRVRADMRSLATAMEAYHVDANAYPIPADPSGRVIADPPAAVGISPFETKIPISLTTPIAYISSRPDDPFATARIGEPRLYHCVTLDYVNVRQTNAPVFNWLIVYRNFFRDTTGRNPPSAIQYWFQSFGPDQIHSANLPHASAPIGPHVHAHGALYDPTNGTVSNGDLLYFGPGVGFAN